MSTIKRVDEMPFEWNEIKRRSNVAKHHIDFQDAKRIFEGQVFERSEIRNGEERTVAIGQIEGIEIVVIYVIRGERRRMISARRAHRDERQEFANRIRRSDERPN